MTEAMTKLEDYMRITGTSRAWLAKEIGVSPSQVTRWCQGTLGMTNRTKAAILVTLKRRADMSLDGLLDDQIEPQAGSRGPRSRGRPSSTPFDQILRGQR